MPSSELIDQDWRSLWRSAAMEIAAAALRRAGNRAAIKESVWNKLRNRRGSLIALGAGRPKE